MVQTRPLDAAFEHAPDLLTGAWIAWTGDRERGAGLLTGAIRFSSMRSAEATSALHVATDSGDAAPALATGRRFVALFDGDLLGAGKPGEPGAGERVIETIEREGIDAVPLLPGEFSVIALDSHSGEIWAIRDRVGTRPLYWTRTASGDLAFSTSVAALLAIPGTSRALNRAVMSEYLCRHYANHVETAYEHVRRVPPASIVRFTRTDSIARRYWDPLPSDKPIEWLSQSEVDRFDEVFEASVAHTAGTGRVGVFLSGGLDSIAVAAVAADLARRNQSPAPLALSLAFPPPGDESSVQQAIAGALELPQRLVPFSATLPRDGLLASALRMGATWPTPMLTVWNPAYAHLAAVGRAEGCRRILTGRGGDECLTISLSYAADLILAADVPGLMRLLRGHYLSYRTSARKVLVSGIWTHGVRRLLGGLAARIAPAKWQGYHAARAAAELPPWLAPDPDLRATLHRRFALARVPRPFGPGNYVRDIRETIEHPVLAYDLEEAFELGRRSGIHTAHPFWNGAVVDFLFRIPPSVLNQPRRAKWLVRDRLQARFPGLGLDKQKKLTASSFFRGTMAREGPASWSAVGTTGALSELGIVDATAMRRLMPALLASPRVSDTAQAWEIMNLELWARQASSR